MHEKKELLRERAGLSLIELVAVLVIVAVILVGFGTSASTQVKRASRSDVENALNVMASNLSDAYYDLGNPSFDPTAADAETKFENFLKILQSEYLGVSFDYDSLTATANGYFIEIAEPLDAYEQRYQCWFVTAPHLDRFAMICSGGDNTIVEHEGYNAGNYSDDIVLVIYPKTGE